MTEKKIDYELYGREIERALDDMIRLGEQARSMRDVLTRRKRATEELPWSHAPVDPLPWDGLGAEMQDTYRRTHAAYTRQLESHGHDLEDHVIEPGVVHYGTDLL
jgi:hypothetical protein